LLTLLFLDYLGTFAFAVSGALKAVRRRMDLFGMIVLAVVTAIGGGTIRDVMVGQRPFWLTDANYILLALLAVAAVFLLYRLISSGETALLWFDAVGLGAFTVIGASRAMDHGVGLVGTVALACLSGVGGGMIRDVLAGDVPVVLRKEVYASASILGAILFWLLKRWGVMPEVSVPVATGVVTAVRLVSLHYGFGLPRLEARKGNHE
jgi:uncharacterized membrane protein YeiH